MNTAGGMEIGHYSVFVVKYCPLLGARLTAGQLTLDQ